MEEMVFVMGGIACMVGETHGDRVALTMEQPGL